MNSITELEAIRKKRRAYLRTRTRIQVGMGTCGIAAGADRIHAYLKEAIEKEKNDGVDLVQVGCIGECAFEPLVEIVEPNGDRTLYVNVTKQRAEEIMKEHVIGGQRIDRYRLCYAKK
ncbi:MAG: (2Fe-2S) ferredoxin domain-containing protein [Acholeplasmataceae bacterium]